MRKGSIGRTATPKMPISIEFEDSDYTYISNRYSYRQLKGDVESIKRPIVIHFNQASQPLPKLTRDFHSLD